MSLLTPPVIARSVITRILVYLITSILFIGLTVGSSVAQTNEKKTPTVILITNVDVWDGTSNWVKKSHDFLIVGDKIEKVAEGIKVCDANVVIDGKGGRPVI